MYLTNKELTYLSDTDFLLTKKHIQQKINSLLVRTEETLKAYIQEKSLKFPEGVMWKAGKIAKGENYRNLPYQMLDFPRLFRRHDIFSVRTMCWWGHFFSITLHLQGNSWEMYKTRIIRQLHRFSGRQLYLCVHPHPWEYHRGEDNFLLLDEMDESNVKQHLAEMPFLKVAAFLPLEDGASLPDFSLSFFTLFSDILDL